MKTPPAANVAKHYAPEFRRNFIATGSQQRGYIHSSSRFPPENLLFGSVLLRRDRALAAE